MIYLSLILLAVMYAFGQARVEYRYAHWFWLGWFSLVAALTNPLHALSEQLFSAHMVQHTIITALSAPLLILGRVGLTTFWALPTKPRITLARSGGGRIARIISNTPAGIAFALHGIALWAWHVPALYDAALQSEWVHALQHLSFVATAMLFWHSVLAPRHRVNGLGKGVVLVFGTAAHTAILGAFIALAPRAWYASYHGASVYGLTALEDQQLAGMIMWVPAGLIYTAAGLALMSEWLKQAELRNQTRPIIATLIACVCITFTACTTERTGGNADASRALTNGNARVGKSAVEQLGCGHCHTIKGARDAIGKVGPPLDGIASRMYIAGVLVNTPENMQRWLMDPKAVDSLTAMPKLGITQAQAKDIAAYLYTLR